MKNTLNLLGVAAIFTVLTLGCGGGATAPAANTPAANIATASNTSAASNSSSGGITKSSTSSSSASGDTIRIEEAGISFVSPAGFKLNKENGVTTVSTADDSVRVAFTTLNEGSFQAGVDAAAKVLDKRMKNVNITQKAEKGLTDGMETVSTAGNGVDKETGKGVAFEMDTIDAPKKPVLVIAYGDANGVVKHEADIKSLFESIKKQ